MPFYNKCVKRGISCLAAGYSPFLISFLVSISCLLLTTLHNPVYFCLQMVQDWYKNHPKTRIYTGFYLSSDFIVGNTIKVKALLGIIPYLSLLQLFALMHYHALLGTIISKFVAILLQKLFFVT